MKYRLTVKGQVALATFLILLSFVAVPLLMPGTEPSSSAVPGPETESTDPVMPESTAKAQEPVTPDQNVPTAEVLEKITAVVYFDPDQWQIQAKEIGKISEMTELLTENPGIKLVVEGNINGINGSGDTEFGKDLSQKRAEVVAQVLIGKGIEESRITVKSNGSSEPATTDPDKGWMNRRTLIYVEGFKGKTP